MPAFKNLEGLKVGRLTVGTIHSKRNGKFYWNAVCSCGRAIQLTSYSLCGKRPTKSCGCYVREVNSKRLTIHGMNNTNELMLWQGANRRAKTKQIPFNIEVTDIIIPDRCPLLGIPIFKLGGKITDNSPSLDRIIPSKGYVKGNVWVISYKANTVKNNCTLGELELLVNNLRNATS